MKKTLGAVTAAVLVFATTGPASAELFKNLTASGQLDVQANSARNVTDFQTGPNDRVGDALTRVVGSLKWDLLDDVHANVTLRKNDRTFGTTGGAGQQNTGGGDSQNLIGAAGGTDAFGNIFLDEANIKIDKLMGHVDATLGRQFYGNPGSMVVYFGPKNSYGLPVTAIDALRVDAMNDWFDFTGIVGKITGHAVGVAGVADVDLRGIDMGWKNLPLKVNTYGYNQVTHRLGALGSPTGKNDFLWVAGVKVRGEAMGGWLEAEAAKNFGENRGGTGIGDGNYTGMAMKADVGYKAEVANVAGFTPWGHIGWGSGNDGATNRNEGFTPIASDYRPGIINGRFPAAGFGLQGAGLGLDATGANPVGTPSLNNRVVWGAGVKVTPSMWEKLAIGLSWYDFRFQKQGSTPAGSNGNKHIGYEFGVTADWTHSENVSVGIGAASFQPGGLIKNLHTTNAVAVEPVTLAFADFTVRF